MKQYTFALDCDEVLRRLLDGMIKLYNRKFDANITRKDIKDFEVEKSFPLIEKTLDVRASEWFFQTNGSLLFRHAPAFATAAADIQTLKKYGKVIIVTHQKSFKNRMDTLFWLEKHGIVSDGVCFLKDKSLIRADFFVDDNDWNFSGCNCENGVLITAPYNKDKSLADIEKTSNCKTLMRFGSLHQFVTWFEKEFVPNQAE